jgi:hypothetical protein
LNNKYYIKLILVLAVFFFLLPLALFFWLRPVPQKKLLPGPSCSYFAASAANSVPGFKMEYGFKGVKTPDNGYVVLGNRSPGPFGEYDIFLMKLTADGRTEWTSDIGWKNSDIGKDVITVKDGYVVAGHTFSNTHGRADVLLFKTDLRGKLLWHNVYGGKDDDYGFAVSEKSSGGYIIAGKTMLGLKGFKMYLVSTDPDGRQLWAKSYGGLRWDAGKAIVETPDKGFIAAGESRNSEGQYDIYAVKVDAGGDCVWSRTYDFNCWATAGSIKQDADGNYLIIGESQPRQKDSTPDITMLKIDRQGNELERKVATANSSDVTW